VYTPTDRLAHEPWGAGITWQVVGAIEAYGCVRGAGACQPILNSQDPRAKRSVGIYTSQ